MKRIFLLLLMFIIVSIIPINASWQYLSTSRNGSVYYIDENSIHYYKNFADIWTKIIERDNAKTVSLLRITADKRYTFLSITHYNKKGEVTFYHDYSYSRPEYFNIVPDSMINAVYTLVYY